MPDSPVPKITATTPAGPLVSKAIAALSAAAAASLEGPQQKSKSAGGTLSISIASPAPHPPPADRAASEGGDVVVATSGGTGPSNVQRLDSRFVAALVDEEDQPSQLSPHVPGTPVVDGGSVGGVQMGILPLANFLGREGSREIQTFEGVKAPDASRSTVPQHHKSLDLDEAGSQVDACARSSSYAGSVAPSDQGGGYLTRASFGGAVYLDDEEGGNGKVGKFGCGVIPR